MSSLIWFRLRLCPDNQLFPHRVDAGTSYGVDHVATDALSCAAGWDPMSSSSVHAQVADQVIAHPLLDGLLVGISVNAQGGP